MRLAIIGAGAWGTSIGSLLAHREPVRIWAREVEVVDGINQRRQNPLYLPGVELSPDLRAGADLASVLDGAEVVLMAVPAQHFRSVLGTARDLIPPATPFLTLTKGMEPDTLLRMSEVAAEVLDGHQPDRIGVLSGPNIAREVAARQPAATVVAVPDPRTAEVLQSALGCPTLRVYTNPDVVGCEIGGTVKNVIALAAGMATGLGYGDNTLAALVTRGLAELTRLGVALGGQPLTFLGLAGIGDLVVTCNSPGSRNRHVGEELGRDRDLDAILSEMTSVAEGVRSCEPVLALGRATGVELPICGQVERVVAGRCSAGEAVEALLSREPSSELHGIS